jgi:transcriptional regulator with XRE-family HTH domain
LGWNQQELATKANIAASTVADFERGKRIPVPNNLDAIRAALSANGILFLPGGAVIGPKAGTNRPVLARDGVPLRLINVTDLEQWADRLDSKAVFPQLLTRLILATTGNGVLQLRFPSDESIQRDDWDGVCEQSVATDAPWLPTGVSGWELATQRQNISTKANGDYTKRTAEPRGLTQNCSTFLFVTLRSWNQGAQWAQAKSAEGGWKAVKALDANDLVHWIELYPAVGYWLASYLNKLPAGLVPLENMWKEWRQATKWPLSVRGAEKRGRSRRGRREPGNHFGNRVPKPHWRGRGTYSIEVSKV